MRKLTAFCLPLAVMSFLFLACRESFSEFSFWTENGSIHSNQNPDKGISENDVLSEYKQQNQGFPFFNLKSGFLLNMPIVGQKGDDRAPYRRFAPTRAVLKIVYFDPIEGEKELFFKQHELEDALLLSDVNINEAVRRTKLIFETLDCSPAILVETALLIEPILPPHTEGVLIASLNKPYEPISDLIEKNTKNPIAKIERKRLAEQSLKEVNSLIGVAGSVMAHGSSRIEFYFCTPESTHIDSCSLTPQSIREILVQMYGNTEGEQTYRKLLLGDLSETNVWSLFTQTLIPYIQRENPALIMAWGERPLRRLWFRYNYMLTQGTTGRLGFTIYDLDSRFGIE
jgi:hypothetical protein